MRNNFINSIPYLFVFLWSTGFISAKYALPFIEPFYLLFLRMVLTIGVFLLIAIILRVKWLSPKQACHQMVTGLLVHGIYLGGVFAAIKWGMPAGITAIVVGVQPVLTAFIVWSCFGTSLRRQQWIGLWLGLAGITTVLLSTASHENVAFGWPAMVAAVSALLAISVGTLYQKRFGNGVDLVAGTVWQYVSTAFFIGIVAWSFETRIVIWDIQLILALAWLVIGLSVTAILLLMYMIREGESAKVASFFYLVPPVASVEAWLLFGETLSLLSVSAILLTVFGVYLVIKK
jgi:drug/metabolite transporter (DMT)-like permease